MTSRVLNIATCDGFLAALNAVRDSLDRIRNADGSLLDRSDCAAVLDTAIRRCEEVRVGGVLEPPLSFEDIRSGCNMHLSIPLSSIKDNERA